MNVTRGGVVLTQASATALTGGTALTVPFPTDATSLGGPHSGLSASAVDVQVYLQSGPVVYRPIGSTPLTVTDTRPPSQVSFLNDLILCKPGCQSLTASESYTRLADRKSVV